ncbi:MAG: polysaccharide deacetylase family protein [Gammaproteobacteria bacterium]|jgi:peptidoglycan/xylan/chitin deacetylase (PgdA/CDA1 family)|nr:polysaccharide deacetylase family protein [Gammaproteobacteria bacterium]MBT3724431.1 polysaccharide deacetylase family protein [Gammaproteobacteria bacterium]MBT4075401.1 polysaccharide deacetylase family protein [Gammaproteobacteria bacterium]MBT4195601.1 polysaccharide deacetylase family protein [Gammaproteobacteria bacterium]MBT4450566.1 polysaccharide deacetylase family protein [Gammaproteobacteria bacterium]
MNRYLLFLLLLLTHTTYAANHCVILQYHHFSDKTPTITSVTPKQFDDHLDYLQKHDFTVMALRDVALSLKHQLELPEKCVSLTVDDAYISVYEEAYPRLKKLGWPLTVFVNTEAVDKGINVAMNWKQMREMSQNGVSFENHGFGHIHMIRMKPKETDRQWLTRVGLDIQTAQRRISQEIGIEPTLFAYPYGEYNPSLVSLIERMGLAGFGQQSGPAWPDANFGALPRFPMAANYANMKSFITKVNTLPLPVTKAEPIDSLVKPGHWRPTLELQLAPGSYSKNNLRCYVGGSDKVDIIWSETKNDSVSITPQFDLKPGRHRTNCTMPSNRKGRFHWYSHNWFIRKENGDWYAEY